MELKFVFIDPKMAEFSAHGKLSNPQAASEDGEVAQAIVKSPENAEKGLCLLCRSWSNEISRSWENQPL